MIIGFINLNKVILRYVVITSDLIKILTVGGKFNDEVCEHDDRGLVIIDRNKYRWDNFF